MQLECCKHENIFGFQELSFFSPRERRADVIVTSGISLR